MIFQVGDIVTSKKLGPPVVGEIIAIWSPKMYEIIKKEQTETIYYTVYFEEPIRHLTVEEIMAGYNFKRQEAEEYWNTLEYKHYFDYPEYDLELF